MKRGEDWLSICARVLSGLAWCSCLQITSTDLDLYQYQTFLSNTLFPLHIIISHLTSRLPTIIAPISLYQIFDTCEFSIVLFLILNYFFLNFMQFRLGSYARCHCLCPPMLIFMHAPITISLQVDKHNIYFLNQSTNKAVEIIYILYNIHSKLEELNQ